MTYQIGNGLSTSLWHDPWHPIGILADEFDNSIISDFGSTPQALVASIIQNNSWRWPEGRRRSRQVIELIRATPVDQVPDCFKTNSVKWTASTTRIYTTKSAYHRMRDSQHNICWSHLVWFKGNIPRFAFITWLACKFTLSTKSRLKAWGVVKEDQCVFCPMEPDTIEHLFFACPYTYEVWKEIMSLH
ncbi:hypothetical protein ACH5RR_021403 [Cinchona calisaya]|uniref:Reverse transcriptase zinc-binding domain-containing protein n=1 Tax=Cinchona calisaya TaxID=153742 RepID=A0ABD2ZI54_9GENT